MSILNLALHVLEIRIIKAERNLKEEEISDVSFTQHTLYIKQRKHILFPFFVIFLDFVVIATQIILNNLEKKYAAFIIK